MTIPLGDDLLIMSGVRRLLSQLPLSPRRAAVAWIGANYEQWPLIDRKGKLVEGAREHETEPPPILRFISDHREQRDDDDSPREKTAGDGKAS